MSEMVHITINKQPLEVPAGTRIIEAAKMLNIDIPHLCYHPDQTIKAHCRMCMVEVVGSRKLTAACSTVAWEGMEVITDSKKVYDAQTGVLDLILSDHKTNCLSCARNGSCELQALCRRFPGVPRGGHRGDRLHQRGHRRHPGPLQACHCPGGPLRPGGPGGRVRHGGRRRRHRQDGHCPADAWL